MYNGSDITHQSFGKAAYMARNAHPEATRQRILDAARKLFAKHGYERTSIQDIINELGDLSKGAIYHHFPNKAAILDALTEADTAQVNAALPLDDDSLSGLQKIRHWMLATVANREHMLLLRDAFPLLNDPKMLSENLKYWRTTNASMFRQCIEDGIKDGSISTQYPREASELLALLSNYWLAPMFYPATAAELKHRVRCLLTMLAAIGLPLFDLDSPEVNTLAEGIALLGAEPEHRTEP